MKFLIVIHADAGTGELFAAMSDEERAAAYRSYFDIEAELEATGELVDSKAASEHQVIVRRGPDGVTAVDAPRPERVPVVSGYYLVEVADEARAVEIAGRFPEAAVQDGIRVARTLTAEDFAVMGS